MQYRKINENGDYVFGDNQGDYLSDTAAVGQAVATKLRMLYGEWFEDISIGLPYFQSMLGQVSNDQIKRVLSMSVTQALQDMAEVQSIKSITVNYDNVNRVLAMQVDVTTTQGDTATAEVKF